MLTGAAFEVTTQLHNQNRQLLEVCAAFTTSAAAAAAAAVAASPNAHGKQAAAALILDA